MSVLGLFQNLRPQEIIIILVIVLLLFGAKKLPEIGRGMGKGIKEFREGVKGIADDVEEGMKDDGEDTGDSASTPKRDSSERPPSG